MMQAQEPPRIEVPADDTPLFDAALMYLALGFRPVPAYGVTADGRCRCSNPKCPPKTRGKHPIGSEWQRHAPRNVDEVREAFSGHTGNIGVYVGDSPVVILDFDGEDGEKTLASFDAPRTLRAQSGSGGTHLYFRLAPWQSAADIPDRSKILPGFDVKKHGQAIAAPSVHYSQRRYAFVDAVPIATLPAAIYDIIKKPTNVIPLPAPRAPQAGDFERARAYVAKMPEAIEGANGSGATFSVARKLAQDFQLSHSDAWSILVEYNQRCQPPWSERELKHKLDDAFKARVSNPVQDRPSPVQLTRPTRPLVTASGPGSLTPPTAPPPDDWRARLLYQSSRKGPDRAVSHLENVIVVLQHHPDWVGKIRYDAFRDCIVAIDPPWHEHHRPTHAESDWSDEDVGRLAAWMRRELHGLTFSPTLQDCKNGAEIVARAHAFHPVRDYFDSLVWDQEPRLSHWLARFCGAEESDYTRAVGRWWLISAVARIYVPGCKADHVLILEGDQGIRKSSALRALAGEWFMDTPIDLNSKDAFSSIQGKLIVELAELDTLFRAESSRAKAFFSSPVDTYRRPYKAYARNQVRQCVFAGTVNPGHGQYLMDPTGARRFWPVSCSKIDLAGLTAARDQLWAEACWAFQEKARWWPETEDERHLLEARQEDRTESDEWAELVRLYVANRPMTEHFTGAELLEKALQLAPRDWTRANQTRLGTVVKRYLSSEFEKKKLRDGKGTQWVFSRKRTP